jgi:hypothetical protein
MIAAARAHMTAIHHEFLRPKTGESRLFVKAGRMIEPTLARSARVQVDFDHCPGRE